MVFTLTLLGEKMYCPKCNSSFDDGNVYCVNCGTRLISGDEDVKKTNPIERHSSRFKTPIPESEPKVQPNSEKRPVFQSNDKIDILILQNKELIRQNNRIIELLEKLVR